MDIHRFIIAVFVMITRIKRFKETISFLPARYWEFIELALVGEHIVGPCLQDNIKAFLIKPHDLAVVAAVCVRVELDSRTFVDTLSHAKIHTPKGHIIQHCHILSHTQWMPVGQDDRCRSNPQLFTVSPDMGAHLYGIGWRVHITIVGKVLFREPRSCKTSVLSQGTLLEDHLKCSRPRDGFPGTEIRD